MNCLRSRPQVPMASVTSLLALCHLNCPQNWLTPTVFFSYTFKLLVSDFSLIVQLELLSPRSLVIFLATTVHGHSSVPIFRWTFGYLTIPKFHPWATYTIIFWLFSFLFDLCFPVSEMGSVFSDPKWWCILMMVWLTSLRSKSEYWELTCLYFKSSLLSKFQIHLSNLLLDCSTWHPKRNLSHLNLPSSSQTASTSVFFVTGRYHHLANSCQLQPQDLGISNSTTNIKVYPFCDLRIS